MTFLWLIVWLLSGCPSVHGWNAWLVALLVCFAMDIFGQRERF